MTETIEETKFVCKICKYDTNIKWCLVNHLQRKKACGTSTEFTREDLLKELTEKEYNDITFDCNYCDKKFNDRSNSYKHMKICKQRPSSSNETTTEIEATEVTQSEAFSSQEQVVISRKDFEDIKQQLAECLSRPSNIFICDKENIHYLHSIHEEIKKEIINNIKDDFIQELTEKIKHELQQNKPVTSQPVTKPLSNNPKKKKQKIPQNLKKACWNTFIGIDVGKSKCKCCNMIDITQHDFNCGHIIAESQGGPLRLENLRPICDKCNWDMGSQDMKEFAMKHYGVVICMLPNISDDNGK